MSFQFEAPFLLTLLLLIPIIGLLGLQASNRNRPAALKHAAAGLARGLPVSWRVSLRPGLRLLRLLTLALVIVALARPQIVQGRELIHGEGIEIALALDISGSMASLDFEPENRLEASRRVIGEFINSRPYDKMGLVVFSSEAFNQSPLTLDHRMLNRSLERVELATELGLDDGTAIGLGLANAANMLVSSEAESKIIILLTDGVNNSGQIDPFTAAQAASALGIKIYTIGAARPGQVPVPVAGMFGGTQIVYQESQLDEAALQRVADLTGGQYFRAEDTRALAAIYDEINALEKTDVEVQVFNQYQELYGWLLIPAAALFVFEFFLRKTVFRSFP